MPSSAKTRDEICMEFCSGYESDRLKRTSLQEVMETLALAQDALSGRVDITPHLHAQINRVRRNLESSNA